MGARRDSNDSHNYRPPVDFWFIPVFWHVTSDFFRGIISTIQQPYKACESRFGIIQISPRHKASKPMIGARNRASALRVALSPELDFCAIAPVG
jgi:hypothetical protein